MGMGEPLANFDPDVGGAAHARRAKPRSGWVHEHITVSTVGLPQGIRRMAGEPLQVNLAVSLHAPNDALRSKLLPVNLGFPIHDVMSAIHEYITATNRRVTFEYALMDRINDTAALARELVTLLKPLRSPTGGGMCHVDLIPLDPVASHLTSHPPRSMRQRSRSCWSKAASPRRCACAEGSTSTRVADSCGDGWTTMVRRIALVEGPLSVH